MGCLICGSSEARMLFAGAWTEFHCPDCGVGRVSQELLDLMMLQRSCFDAALSREWVTGRRQSDPLPIMRVSDLPLVIALHGSTN